MYGRVSKHDLPEIIKICKKKYFKKFHCKTDFGQKQLRTNQERGHKKSKFELNNFHINYQNLSMSIRYWAKFYVTNQKNGQSKQNFWLENLQ